MAPALLSLPLDPAEAVLDGHTIDDCSGPGDTEI